MTDRAKKLRRPRNLHLTLQKFCRARFLFPRHTPPHVLIFSFFSHAFISSCLYVHKTALSNLPLIHHKTIPANPPTSRSNTSPGFGQGDAFGCVSGACISSTRFGQARLGKASKRRGPPKRICSLAQPNQEAARANPPDRSTAQPLNRSPCRMAPAWSDARLQRVVVVGDGVGGLAVPLAWGPVCLD